MKYTLDTLKKINERFIESHRMKESDVEMANAYVELIERTRSTTEPQPITKIHIQLILILYGIGMSQGKTSWR